MRLHYHPLTKGDKHKIYYMTKLIHHCTKFSELKTELLVFSFFFFFFTEALPTKTQSVGGL